MGERVIIIIIFDIWCLYHMKILSLQKNKKIETGRTLGESVLF